MRWWTLLGVMLVGCDSFWMQRRSHIERTDTHHFCLVDEGSPDPSALRGASTAAGEPMRAGEPFSVVFSGVYGGRTVTRAEAACTVTVSGDVITLTTYSSHWSTAAPNSDPMMDLLIGRCDGPALPAGDYTLQHGGKAWDVSIPGAPAVACFHQFSQ